MTKTSVSSTISTPRWLWLAAALVLCVLAYLPSLSGGFLFDDFPTIVENPAMRQLDGTPYHWLVVALSSSAGVLRRPLSMMSLGLDYYLFGLNPYAFKLMNLAIHLANGALVYALARRLAPRLLRATDTAADSKLAGSIAVFATALWLLHPLHVSSVAYAVQRMNLLASLFTLAGLVCYAEGRLRMLEGQRGAFRSIAGLCLFGLLATLSKENGALIAAYALVIEWSCFRYQAADREQSQWTKRISLLTFALPLLLLAAFLTLHPHWLMASYDGRDFTLTERLLSESRILCDYLSWILLPLPRWLGFFHDDIATSTGAFSPPSTIFALAFLAALLFAGWRLRRSSPGFAFAVAWYFAGHAMESTLLPLELVFEHRNYLPMVGLLLGLLCVVAPVVQARTNVRGAAIFGVALLFGVTALTTARAFSWGDPLRRAVDDASHHPDSARSQYEAGRLLLGDLGKNHAPGVEQEAAGYFERATLLDPGNVFPATGLLRLHAATGPVAAAEIEALAKRLRTTRHYTQANAFFDLLNTAAEGKLSLTRQDLQQLVEAALDNPQFPPMVRATILHNFGRYLFIVAQDKQAAVSLLLAAAATDPQNPYFEITLTRVALALNRPDMALQHLQSAQRLDRVGNYKEDIASLQAQLH